MLHGSATGRVAHRPVREGVNSSRRDDQTTLALQLELCLPKLVSSPAPGGLDRRASGFQPEFWPQGQSNQRTPLTLGSPPGPS